MKVEVQEIWNHPSPSVDAEDKKKTALLTCILIDADGQEDIYLGEITKAEAGETITDLYNNYVDVQLYPDGRAIVEELRYTEEDEIKHGPPARIEVTVAEVKQLLLDWLAAKEKWYEQKAPAAPGG